jgi:hypothetical protein
VSDDPWNLAVSNFDWDLVPAPVRRRADALDVLVMGNDSRVWWNTAGADAGPGWRGWQVVSDNPSDPNVSTFRRLSHELGYLPLPAEAASAIFQVVSRRVEHGSIIVTTNRGIASWGEIFSDSMMAAAILDRFLFKATLLSITGDSYRMRAHRARLDQLREGVGATLER